VGGAGQLALHLAGLDHDHHDHLEKAQQELPLLVKRALADEDIVIEAAGEAAIRLAPIEPAAERTVMPGTSYRGRGALKGQLVVGSGFFEPLSDDNVVW
jgi:antitoxin (DNA-binding transcriptional repressor) of toxin-antitoxin stability system